MICTQISVTNYVDPVIDLDQAKKKDIPIKLVALEAVAG